MESNSFKIALVPPPPLWQLCKRLCAIWLRIMAYGKLLNQNVDHCRSYIGKQFFITRHCTNGNDTGLPSDKHSHFTDARTPDRTRHGTAQLAPGSRERIKWRIHRCATLLRTIKTYRKRLKKKSFRAIGNTNVLTYRNKIVIHLPNNPTIYLP